MWKKATVLNGVSYTNTSPAHQDFFSSLPIPGVWLNGVLFGENVSAFRVMHGQNYVLRGIGDFALTMFQHPTIEHPERIDRQEEDLRNSGGGSSYGMEAVATYLTLGHNFF